MTPQSRGVKTVLCERELTIVGHYRHDSDVHGRRRSQPWQSDPCCSQSKIDAQEDNGYYSMTVVPQSSVTCVPCRNFS